jgi:hypothetical protein
MTTMVYGAVWINLASALTDVQSFSNTTMLKVTTEQDGSVRRLANGRLRAVLGATEPRTWELQFELCSRTQITWLQDRVGQLVCVRDDRGRKVYGTYFAVPVNETIARSEYGDVTITVQETTHSEAV